MFMFLFSQRSTTIIPKMFVLSFGQHQWSTLIHLTLKKHMTMDISLSEKDRRKSCGNVFSVLIVATLHRDVCGKQALISWWHGKGGLIDYTNEDALEWWHKQMDNVS